MPIRMTSQTSSAIRPMDKNERRNICMAGPASRPVSVTSRRRLFVGFQRASTKRSKRLFRIEWSCPRAGHLNIQPTEALTVIDVNSGRFTSSRTQAETVRRTNVEAAQEIPRQLRLRNIGRHGDCRFYRHGQPQRSATGARSLPASAGRRPSQAASGAIVRSGTGGIDPQTARTEPAVSCSQCTAHNAPAWVWYRL